ncbi:MAG: 6-phosphofructokinase [Chloroflexota bacterium]|jgi:phosphofructokinase-like protein
MRVAVLTGGGDAAGLNAAIRAVVRRAISLDFDILGVRNGWDGLLGGGNLRRLDTRSVSGILHLGGTVLGTSRANPLKSPEDFEQVLANIKAFGIEGLVVIGGPDTLGVAAELQEKWGKVVGVPKTIDNTLNGSDASIGYSTAVAVVAEALDRLHTTASSHHRVLLAEVMGRDAGWVATAGGLAGGADMIIIPEEPTDLETICNHVLARRARGREFSIIVVSEAAVITDLSDEGIDLGKPDPYGRVKLDRRNIGERLAAEIEKRTGLETRFIVLGYLQRGGAPTAEDRILATRLGVAAVDYLAEGKFGNVPCLCGGKLQPIPLRDVVSKSRPADMELYQLAKLFF